MVIDVAGKRRRRRTSKRIRFHEENRRGSDCNKYARRSLSSSYSWDFADYFASTTISMIPALLLMCYCAREALMVMTAEAYIQQSYHPTVAAGQICALSKEWRSSYIVSFSQSMSSRQRILLIDNNIRQWNNLSCLAATGGREKKGSSSNEDDPSTFPPSGFFSFRQEGKDGSSREGQGSAEKRKSSRSFSFVGRLLGGDSEKEKKSRKKYNSKNKTGGNDEEKPNIAQKVGNYFRERQIRKDAEELRREVQRREKERKQQLERDSQELRLEVLRREEARKRKLEEQQRKLSTTTIGKRKIRTKRKIEAQKDIDKKTRERIEKIREDRGKEFSIIKQRNMRASLSPATKDLDKKDGRGDKRNKDKNDTDQSSPSSGSRRINTVVGAAQKLVSGVLEQMKTEEWVVVAPKTRISPGEIVAVTEAGIDLLLIASKDGSALHCVANSCPHLGTPLEIGSLERLPIESSSSTKSASPPISVNRRGNNITDSDDAMVVKDSSFFKETDISRMLKEDGCEDCIVCPLHKTAFALKSGEVRGEWCPYPPVIGKLTGAVKGQSNLPVFDVRTRGKNIEVRLNTPVEIMDSSRDKKR